MKTVIGIVGEKGSGKDTFAEALMKDLAGRREAARIRSSEILAETLDLWYLPKNRHNLQYLAIIMDREFGKGTLTEAVRNRITASPAEIVIFDALRWQSDADMIRSFKNNILVYIEANSANRYERTKLRKEKIDEASTTYETFMEEEKVATELDIVRIGEIADVKIDNNGTIEEFEEKIKDFRLSTGL